MNAKFRASLSSALDDARFLNRPIDREGVKKLDSQFPDDRQFNLCRLHMQSVLDPHPLKKLADMKFTVHSIDDRRRGGTSPVNSPLAVL
jgi:hypothetical protein